ncbi:50S ribosomal protein L20 [Candidatus Kaiserbacteria bacterium]|nr:50S ribosomal protein L20 [Candidatus Kaiserbacteria bacterium]
MTRIKGGVHANKRRKNILERAKGYRGIRSKKLHAAHEALMRAGRYAFAHRRDKKTDFRQLWIVRLNAALRDLPAQAGNRPMSYSTFINKLKKSGITLDRKVLAQFASDHPQIFSRIAKQVI